jgi:serine/threonine protein kinase
LRDNPSRQKIARDNHCDSGSFDATYNNTAKEEVRGSTDAEKRTLEIEALLGRGASANVYLARYREDGYSDDNSKSRHVAVKVVTRAADALARDESMLKEVRAMAAVQQHPNIAGFYGVVEVERAFADIDVSLPCRGMQLEYCSGGDLHSRVSRWRFDETEARHAMQGILRGLSHMHKRGYVHRDIKPANIMWTDDRVAKIADFGLCCHISDNEEMKRNCGTVGYAAPEVILKQTYGLNADCFSVGILLYFLLSGKLPFTGPDSKSVMQKSLSCPLNFRKSMRLECLSERCRDFMVELTVRDPLCRPPSDDALKSPWLSQEGSVSQTNVVNSRKLRDLVRSGTRRCESSWAFEDDYSRSQLKPGRLSFGSDLSTTTDIEFHCKLRDVIPQRSYAPSLTDEEKEASKMFFARRRSLESRSFHVKSIGRESSLSTTSIDFPCRLRDLVPQGNYAPSLTDEDQEASNMILPPGRSLESRGFHVRRTSWKTSRYRDRESLTSSEGMTSNDDLSEKTPWKPRPPDGRQVKRRLPLWATRNFKHCEKPAGQKKGALSMMGSMELETS